ncbi:MAG: DJ-1/PfpI family protein, partial [Maribacter sp.]
MKIAYIIFNGITTLDFIGIYDALSRLKALKYIPDLEWDICSFTDSVKDNFGLGIVPQKIGNALSGYDVIIVPGGFGTRELQYDTTFLDWLKTSQNVATKVSICTGSLLLGAAGFLKDKTATTNYQSYKELEPYCKKVVEDRIVEDKGVITAGAVSTSIN